MYCITAPHHSSNKTFLQNEKSFELWNDVLLCYFLITYFWTSSQQPNTNETRLLKVYIDWTNNKKTFLERNWMPWQSKLYSRHWFYCFWKMKKSFVVEITALNKGACIQFYSWCSLCLYFQNEFMALNK